jgi:hypothetical protein
MKAPQIPKMTFSTVVQKRGVFDACDDEGKVVLFVERAKKWTFSHTCKKEALLDHKISHLF